jgi:serine/threonine-protein kinase
MPKYKLSKNVSVIPREEMDADDLPEHCRTGYLILYNKSKDKEYLINETIGAFIEKFSTPKSPAMVIREVAADADTDIKNVTPICMDFIRFLRKKGIILPEKEEERDIAAEPFYQPGERIGGCRIDTLIANKRSIDIYGATDEAGSTPCVIKLLNRNKMQDEKRLAKDTGYLEREYNLLKRMDGEASICQALDFGQDASGNPYIVLEYIEGQPILRFIKETPRLSMDEVSGLFQKMLFAFARLHRHGTVHGDIHSGNVLVTPVQSVKLIDLGLSINKSMEEKQLVKYGGVDFYMPPERITTTSVKKFAGAPDFHSDVYQIGLLMYAALYDNYPFNGFLWEDLAAAIKKADIQFPDQSSSGHTIPAALKGIIRRCMSREPGKRFKDAGAILEAYLKGMVAPDSSVITHA